jgi:hypothetical protein
VFIDDLDRCFPDNAIKLLESIKLILSKTGFIFILGVAKQVIEGYLNHRYKQEFGLVDFEGQKYLDKIVQLQFPIPPHNQRIKDFSSVLLDQLESKDRSDFAPILPIIGAACAYNPRSTVRFINNLIIDKAISRSLYPTDNDPDIPIDYFAITRGLQQRWLGFFNEFLASEELCQKVAKLGQINDQEIPDLTDQFDITINKIVEDKDLVTLLSSEAGKNWLNNRDYRSFAIDFLRTQRQIQESDIIETSRIEGFKYRVYELAKDCNMTNTAFLKQLSKMGIKVKSHMSPLTDEQVKLVKSELSSKKTAR